MTKTFAFAALAATLSLAAPAFAQAPEASKAPPTAASEPASPSTSATGSSSDTAATASAGAAVTTGMSVKDNTGAMIGEVSDVKAGVATIKMGADTFTVDTSKLGVANGAATINATAADIRGMLKKK
ncbi:MAG: hypothetical protein ACREE0_14305 [Phenylobacterium sp.]